EAAGREVCTDLMLQDSSRSGAKPAGQIRFSLVEAQELWEAERKDLGGQRSAAQTGSNVRTQQLGGRARDIHRQLLGVQHTPDKHVPPLDPLHLIEEEVALLVLEGGQFPEVGLEGEVKICGAERQQAFG